MASGAGDGRQHVQQHGSGLDARNRNRRRRCDVVHAARSGVWCGLVSNNLTAARIDRHQVFFLASRRLLIGLRSLYNFEIEHPTLVPSSMPHRKGGKAPDYFLWFHAFMKCGDLRIYKRLFPPCPRKIEGSRIACLAPSCLPHDRGPGHRSSASTKLVIVRMLQGITAPLWSDVSRNTSALSRFPPALSFRVVAREGTWR